MCRIALRAGAWALAGTVMITLAAGCSVSRQAPAPDQGPGPQIFTMKMVTDHRKLDRGVLAYSALATVRVRQAASFEVKVTDVGRGPETSAFTRQSRGWVVDRQNVPTGGTVRVQIACGAGLACAPQTSSADQAILRPGRSATWTWNITGRSAGDDEILITAVSYRGDSRVVASQTSAAAIVKVRSTTVLYTLEAAIDARKKAVVFVVADVLAALLVLGVVLDLRRRRGRGRPASQPASRPADRAAEGARPLLARRGKTWPRLRGRSWLGLRGRSWLGLRGRSWLRLRGSGWLGLRGRSWLGLPGRTWLGLRGRAWLLLAAIDIAVGALVVVLVRYGTSKSPAFALIAAGVAVVLLPVYFLPVFLARARRLPDLAPVVVINVFLGWTFVGWVVALALAVRDRRPGRTSAPEASRTAAPEPGRAAAPEPGREHPGPAADVTLPRMRLQPVPPRGSATLNVWQTPDDGLTCQQPAEDWVRRWTYGVLLGEDATPQFVLTGERDPAA